MKSFSRFCLLFLIHISVCDIQQVAYRNYFPNRKLITDGMYENPTYNQFSEPGAPINPLAFQSPMYPRYGQSSMLPSPPPIFHDGVLPIMSIYELHHPKAYTPTSPYGLPSIYNPYHGMNLPYNYLHHPYAPQIMTSLSANELAAENYEGNPESVRNMRFSNKVSDDMKTIKQYSNLVTNSRKSRKV